MPIQTVVASLVLLYLRDEMVATRSILAELRKRSASIDDLCVVDNWRGGLTYQLCQENRINIHELYIDSDGDNACAIRVMHDDIHRRIINAEMDLIQAADSYNHLLTLVRMDANPAYVPVIKCERPFVYTRKGHIIE